MATSSSLGVVQPDNSTITISGGVISAGSGAITPSSILVLSTDQNAVPSGSGSNFFATPAFITETYDSLVVDPGFPNISALAVDLKQNMGFNNYGTDAGGTTTTNKLTPISLSVSGEYVGSGEHFILDLESTNYGMSDSFLFSMHMDFATGPIAGDEGQAYTPTCWVRQQPGLSYGTILSVKRTTWAGTTVAAAITGSKTSQSIAVISSAGAVVGDWIVFNQLPPSTNISNLIWAATVDAIIDATHIQCICPINFSGPPNAPTITPAMVLTVLNPSGNQFGQDRVLVNVDSSSAQEARGTASISSGTVVVNGSGTFWSPTMVGGNVNNIGAISFDDDTYNNAPFNGISVANGTLTTSSSTVVIGTGTHTFTISSGLYFFTGNLVLIQLTSDPHNFYMQGTVSSYSGTSFVVNVTTVMGTGSFSAWTISNIDPGAISPISWPLRSWYQIINAPTSTSLTILSNTTYGLGYYGNATVAGTYVVKPAARILLLPPTGEIVCETTNSVWNVGDKVECSICPYPYMYGFNFNLAQYTPGGVRQYFMGLFNLGARMIDQGLSLDASTYSTIGQSGSDIFAYNYGVSISSSDVSLRVLTPQNATCGVQFFDQFGTNTDNAGQIQWTDPTTQPFYIKRVHTNQGMQFGLAMSRLGINTLTAVAASSLGITGTPPNPYNLPEIEWQGWFRLAGDNGLLDPFLEFGAFGAPTGDRMQIKSYVSAGTGAFQQRPGFDFQYVTGTGTGTVMPLFSMGSSSTASSGIPFAGVPPQNLSISGTNYPSAMLAAVASVYNSGAQVRPVQMLATPDSNTVNSPITFKMQFFDPAAYSGPYYYGAPTLAFSVSEVGNLFFGHNGSGGPIQTGVTLVPPTQTNNLRTVTFPDMNGGNVVIPPTTATPPTSAGTAGTAGQCIIDSSGNVYICWVTGATPGTASWLKLTGTNV